MPMLTIATRRSTLAMIQSEMIKAALISAGMREVTLLPLTTTGDERKEQNLQEIGGKGVFTKEIELALLDGRAELAMHSLKDMPVEMPEELCLAGVLPRANPRDLLISHTPLTSLEDLPENAVIGTSSPRRAAQLLALRPDINPIPFRGNVPTRLKKVEQGEVDATILAAAGLQRLQLKPAYALPLPCTPAIGQGLIAIQCRKDDTTSREWAAKITDGDSWHQALAERALLTAIGGDCHTPLAGHATVEGGQIHLAAEVLSPDGQTAHRLQESAPLAEAEILGQQCGQKLRPLAESLWQSC